MALVIKTRLMERVALKLASMSNEIVAIDKAEKIMVENYLIQSTSLESYAKKEKVTTKRIVKSWSFFAFLLLGLVKWSLLVKYNDEWFLATQGEFLYKMYKIKVVAGLYVLISCLIIAIVLGTWCLESKSKLHCLDLLYHLRLKSMAYRLEPKNEKNFLIITSLLVEVFVSNGKAVIIVISIAYSGFALLAYLDHSVNHSIILLSINLCATVIWVRKCVILGMGTSLLFYCPLFYLKLRFNEIFLNLKKGLKERNPKLIFYSIAKHKQTSSLTKALSDYINLMIGVNYTLTSTGIVIVLHFHNLMINLKIEELIAGLNEHFIGFYCFNLFKFTRMTFLQFYGFLTTSYILVNRVLKQS